MPLSERHAEWAKALAESLIGSDEQLPTDLTIEQRLSLAWALKNRVDAAWSSDPAQVPRALRLMQWLRDPDRWHDASAPNAEIDAICEWVHGIASITSGRMNEALAHLDQSAASFHAAGEHLHAVQAKVPKIMALSVLGQHAEAAECAVSARHEFKSLGDFHAAGKVSLNLGNLYAHSEDYPEALVHYQEAATVFAAAGDFERSTMSDIGMANAHTALGHFDDAERLFTHAAAQASQHGLHVLEAMASGTAALIFLARGKYGKALARLENMRRRYEALAMPQFLAIAEKQLADVYVELRMLPEALSLFERALPRFVSLEMPVDQAWCLSQYGRVLAALERPVGEVVNALTRAGELFSEQGVAVGRATVSLARAELSLIGDDPETACKFAEEAANIFAAAHVVAGRLQADVVHAQALLQSGDVDSAEKLFKRTLSAAQALQLLSITVRCQVGLGRVANARGDVATAEATFEAAIADSEEQRSALPGDDIRGAFLMDQLRPYEQVLRIALAAADVAPSNESASRVLVQLERFRARALGERLGEAKLHRAQSPHDNADIELRARLSWLYRSTQKLIDEGDDAQTLTAEARRIEHEILERARRRRMTSDSSTLTSDATAFKPSALQAALESGHALVEYGVVDDELFACVVTPDHIALQRRIARWPDVVEAIRSARFQIETMRYGAGAVGRHLDLLTRRSQAAMRRVHDLVWAPIRPLLDSTDQVVIVAHDLLGSLQFAALHDGENYLAERIEIAVAASAKVALYGISHPPCVLSHALVLGESSRLAHAAQEVKQVAALFANADILLDAAANAAGLRAAGAVADVLHLACHAEFRSDNPMFSALQLADGPFTVQDAETLHLRQGIVVLSACETGVAAYSRGDEVIGLVRAFMLAGAARVVASMWPVDDATTVEFMSAFYQSLRNGVRPAQALRSAQLELKATHPHPFHWAAFTLYGGH